MVIFDDNTRNPTINLNNTRDVSVVDQVTLDPTRGVNTTKT